MRIETSHKENSETKKVVLTSRPDGSWLEETTITTTEITAKDGEKPKKKRTLKRSSRILTSLPLPDNCVYKDDTLTVHVG